MATDQKPKTDKVTQQPEVEEITKTVDTKEPAAKTSQESSTPPVEALKADTPEVTKLDTKDESPAEESPVIKRGFKKVRVDGFNGLYKNAVFNDDVDEEGNKVSNYGICHRIEEHVLESLKTDFPQLVIEEL